MNIVISHLCNIHLLRMLYLFLIAQTKLLPLVPLTTTASPSTTTKPSSKNQFQTAFYEPFFPPLSTMLATVHPTTPLTTPLITPLTTPLITPLTTPLITRLVSNQAWQVLAIRYADQLENCGQLHKAVTFLLAAKRCEEAIDLFRRQRFFKSVFCPFKSFKLILILIKLLLI